jgi:hypothetical protein
MNTLKKVLVTLTAMGVLASLHAEIVAQVKNPQSPVLTTGGSTGYSFADIVDLRAGADDRLLTLSTSTQVAGITLVADISSVDDSTSSQSEGANTTVLDADSTLKHAVDDVSGVVDPDESSKSGAPDWHADAGFLFSISEVPEPADWMTLLCGFVIVAFMARRKNGPFAG